ncbi:hypothetical protein dqs_1911 [Azoarcus olearius]|uniref:DUF748 domain-containing protein n=1 Tax=Azoarcus sp. (strain BH72) TaxID=418699 RepID=UPI00080640FC|nr:DUF748 domain-containing protein [Azoarcus olearius]ANQ84949.1 hypothetical protein dqs_1911 [Azoarcus olearius]
MSAARRRRIAVWTAAVAVSLLALYTAAGFLLLPWLVSRKLPELVSQRFGLQLTLDALRINPFLLTLEAGPATLTQPDGNPLLVAQSARFDLDWAGVPYRHWTLDQVSFDGVKVQLVRDQDGRWLLPRAPAPAAAAEAAPARQDAAGTIGATAPDAAPPPAETPVADVLIRHLALRNATLTLIDRASPDAALAVAALDAEIDGLATAPSARPASYRVGATLPGDGRIAAEGEFALAGRHSSGTLRLDAAPLAPWWPLVQRDWRLAAPGGRIDSASARYWVALAGDQPEVTVEQLALQASALTLQPENAREPLLALDTLSIAEGRLDLAGRQLVLRGLRLAGGSVGVSADADGTLDWARLRRQPAASATEEAPWQIELPQAELSALAVRYRELAGAGRRIESARVDARADLVLGGSEGGAAIHALHGTLAAPRYTAADAPPLAAGRIEIADGHLDTAQRSVGAARLALVDIRFDIAVDADGRVVLPAALGRSAPAAAPRADTAGSAARPAWRYNADEVVADGIDLGVEDRRADSPIALRLAGRARLTGVDSRADSLGFDAELRVDSGGTLRAEGRAAGDGSRAEARLRVEGLALAPAAPMLERHATVRLKDGRVGGDVQLRYSAAESPRLRAEGSVALAALRVVEAENDRPLFSAGEVAAHGALQLAPGSLHLDKVVLGRPEARLIIDRDRKLNLANLKRGDKGTPDTGVEEAARRAGREVARATTPGTPRGAPEFPLRVERVELRDGIVEFADFSLVLPFSTRVEQLAGQMLGIDNRPGSEAVVDARGRIQPHGEARAEGRIRPFAPDELTDLEVRFDNVAMPQLSPYSATFAGRKIASGRLWLGVRYRVFDRELDGNNAITLEDFRLGERVDAPNALDLPLELALALLKDPDGRVHLEVPVRGRVDDARFEYGQVVRDAIGNVLRRVVTAPFRFLGRLAGGGEAEDDEAVAFEAGSARLAAQEEERLGRLAEALAQRPQLRLAVHGTWAAEDEAALREQALRREIARAAGQPVDAAGPAVLDFGDPAVQRAVARHADTSGEESVAGAAAGSETAPSPARKRGGGAARALATADDCDPQHPAQDYGVASLPSRRGQDCRRGQAGPHGVDDFSATAPAARGTAESGEPVTDAVTNPTARYRQRFEALAARQPLPEDALRQLAERRAQAVREFLAARGVAAERITLRDASAAGGKPGTELALEAEAR